MRGREAAGTPPSVSGLPNHSGSEKQVPPQGDRVLALRREPPESTFYCRELVCCHVQRPQQHEGLWLLFLFHFLHFHFYGFSSFLCAVDAVFLLSFRPHGARWRYCTTEPLCSFMGPLGQEPRPSLQGSNAQNGNCTRDLFLCCVDRRAHGCIQGLQGPRGLCHRWTRGLPAILHKCLLFYPGVCP